MCHSASLNCVNVMQKFLNYVSNLDVPFQLKQEMAGDYLDGCAVDLQLVSLKNVKSQ